MAWYEFIFQFGDLTERVAAFVWASIFWFGFTLILAVIWALITLRIKKKAVDVSALASLASSDASVEESNPNADPKEVMTILSIERVAASTALSAVKDATKNKRISSSVASSLTNRYKARIAKIDADLKRRSGAQEYQSLAKTLEASRDRLRGEIGTKTPPPPAKTTTPPPPPSATPGIPSTAPPVPGTKPPSSGPPTGPPSSSTPSIPKVPSSGPPSVGTPPTKPSSPIPTPPKIPSVGPSSAKPTTVVPPSVAPPTISTPPLPPKTQPSSPTSPPTTPSAAPPPVPTSAASDSAPTGDSDAQSISGLRMEMLRELARLKKFMSEESQ